MKIAIATDQDVVASGLGCSPFCRIVDSEDGLIRDTLLIPNPGGNHAFWADLFVRNAITFVIAGSMGPTARTIMIGKGIQPALGVRGQDDDVVRRCAAGEFESKGLIAEDAADATACCECTS